MEYRVACCLLHLFSFPKALRFANAQVFSKPHNHLLLGLYCLGRNEIRLEDYSSCKINSKGFHLTIVQLNPVKTGEGRNE